MRQRLRPPGSDGGVLTEVQMKPGGRGGGSRGHRQTVMKQQCDPAAVRSKRSPGEAAARWSPWIRSQQLASKRCSDDCSITPFGRFYPSLLAKMLVSRCSADGVER